MRPDVVAGNVIRTGLWPEHRWGIVVSVRGRWAFVRLYEKRGPVGEVEFAPAIRLLRNGLTVSPFNDDCWDGDSEL